MNIKNKVVLVCNSVQNLNLSEWRLNVMLMNVRDSSDYITVQVDVVPESMEDEKLSEIKDVSSVDFFCDLIHTVC